MCELAEEVYQDVNVKCKCQTQGVLSRSSEPEAYDKVLDNEALRHFCILGIASGIQRSVPRHIGNFTS